MIGQTISHYRVLEKLGQGGMGTVYLAQDTTLDRKVALKFLPPELQEVETARKRFLREARSAAAIDHPYVCAIHEIGESAGQAFLALEYVEGPTLGEKLAAGSLPLGESLKIAVEIAEALEKAHKAGIVHRDLKPSNVMLTAEGHVKVMDFGLAKQVVTEEAAGQEEQTLTALTGEGSLVGTPAYMSPEQLRGLPVDRRSDIFSFGVVVYEMLTGQHPFLKARPMETADSILNETPPPLTRYAHEIPDALQHTVQKMLAKDPDQRYQSVHEVRTNISQLLSTTEAELSAPLRGSEPAARDDGIRSPWQRALPGAVGAAVLLAISLGAYYYFGQEAAVQERIPIAVVDVANETQEEELDGLSGMLITALEQSRRLSVLTRSRMFDILRQLDRGDVEHIDEALGREICRVAGVNWMAIASIRKFGSLYTVDLKILDQERNRYVFTSSERGEGQESIPDLIDRLADQTRKNLREGEEEIEAKRHRTADVTTPNLEAYQHYFIGEELVDKLELDSAIEHFQQAVSLDPSFGLAYYRLGYAYHLGSGSSAEAEESLSKAIELIDRIPEKEQYLARAYAVHLGHGEADLREGIAILREMETIYPNSKEMIFFIGDWSYHSGRYEDSLVSLERALAMDPVFRRALLHLTLLFRDTGNYERMLEIAQRNASLGENAETTYLLGSAYARIGRYEEGVAILERALTMEEIAPIYHEIAYAQTLSGDLEKAEATARAALEIDPTDVWSRSTLNEILLEAGQAAEAETLARQAVEDSPGFHSWNLLARALVAGGIDAEEGLALALDAADQLPLRYEERASSKVFFPLVEETLGQAYGSKGDHEKALLHLEQAAELAPLRPGIQESLRHAREMAAKPH